MNFDAEHHLGSVRRTVDTVERDGKAAKAVTLERNFPTTIEDLWDALTSSERIPRWFLPISGDLKLGGHYQFEGNAGGEITQCKPPSILSVTWIWQDDVSWVEVKLSQIKQDLSQLTLIHTALVSDFWTEYGPGATGVGWEMGLVGLEQHLVDPDEPQMDEEQLALLPEWKAFAAGSSKDWGRASIAAGTDSTEALEAAKQTTAFYTGDNAEDS